VESFRHAAAAAMGQSVAECREAAHLLRLAHALPRSRGELEARRQELYSRRRRDELAESVAFLRHSAAVREWLGADASVLEQALLLPIEKLCQKPKGK
jgi:hypothetical protein